MKDQSLLHEAADRLTAALESADELIRETFSLPASIPLSNGMRLAASKEGIHVLDSGNLSCRPIVSTSIVIRIEAAGKIPALWEALLFAESDKTDLANKAALALEGFLTRKATEEEQPK
jgi:hypothetical protein